MDFIKIEYTGRIKEGNVFDTTDAETAKKENIFDERRVYKPLSVIVGAGQVVSGLDEALKSMKVGDKKSITVDPEKGYGKRSSALVKLVPIKHFKQQKINPIPGLPVEIDGMRGRVQTVAGGRVRVDFNHELAGRVLEYDLEVVDKASKEGEKIKYLIERNFESLDGFDQKIEGKKLTLSLPKTSFHDRNLLVRKASFTTEAFKYMQLSNVVFQEDWLNPEKEDKAAGKSKPAKKDKASE